MNKYIITILKEQFRRVNTDFPNDKYFKKENWFLDNEWTTEEEQDFKKWFFNYMLENKEARQELMKFPSTDNIEKTVDEFIMNYGWKTKTTS